MFDADGKQCLLNTPESKAGLKALADLYSSGAAIPWQPDISEQVPELFQSQKVGMVIQTSFAAFTFLQFRSARNWVYYAAEGR